MPEAHFEVNSYTQTSELLERIKVRVRQILDGWNNTDEMDVSAQIIGLPRKGVDAKIITEIGNPKTENPTADKSSISIANSLKPRTAMMRRENGKTIYPPETTQKREQKPEQHNQINLFDISLLCQLDERHIQYIDNRKTGSFLWVIDLPERHDEITQVLSRSGMVFSFEKRGAIATGNKAAFCVK